MTLRAQVLIAACFLALPATLASAGGPPIVLVEPPAADSAADVALVVRAVQCGAPLGKEIDARAEGLVAGERRTVRLALRSTAQEGVYTVKRTWPTDGRWVLVFALDNHGKATTIVEIAENGLPARDEKGTMVTRSEARAIPEKEIAALLSAPRSTNRRAAL